MSMGMVVGRRRRRRAVERLALRRGGSEARHVAA